MRERERVVWLRGKRKREGGRRREGRRDGYRLWETEGRKKAREDCMTEGEEEKGEE